MGKINITTLSGLTVSDGSILASGATIKFESIFQSGSNDILIIVEAYRSRELFEEGYDKVKVKEIPLEIILTLTDEEFFTITPYIVYQKVRDYLNDYVGENIFEIEFTEEE